MSDNMSAYEKGKLNLKNYEAYVADLESTGQKFPINQFGNVNLEQVAKTCGFLRDVFSRPNSKLRKRLDEDAKRIGTELHQGTGEESRLAEKATRKTMEASRLRKELDARVQEIDLLRGQIEKLSAQLREAEQTRDEKSLAMDEMLGSGRRFEL